MIFSAWPGAETALPAAGTRMGCHQPQQQLQKRLSPPPRVRIPRLTLLFLPSAAACEFLDIVELLLKSGADPTLRDQEGCLPEEVTDCKAITSALQQHTAGGT